MMHKLYLVLLGFAIVLGAPGSILHAQSNFSFWVGGTGVYYDDKPLQFGTSVGANGKFNFTDLLLVRGQFNVDRIQMQDVRLPDFEGNQTVTFISLGAGPEIAAGTKDFEVLAHITPHGNIRTTSRILTGDDGQPKVWSLTRFSLGLIGGVGFQAYFTDNVGFEIQLQYDIYNFDETELDPGFRGLRALMGVQFYLGRNYLR